jgi:hypothetical protein
MKFGYQKLPLGNHDSRNPLIPRPLVPIYLVGKERRTRSPYFALLDSGADKVIFPAELAEEVGVLSIEKGVLEPTLGIAGQRADVYYHLLGLQLLGDLKVLPTEVGFSREVGLPILGRTFFRHFKTVSFSEEQEEIEFKEKR